MSKAWLIEEIDSFRSITFHIAYGETLDSALKTLECDKRHSTSSQRIPELDNVTVLKVNKNTVFVDYNGKKHCLFTEKTNHFNIICSKVSVNNGKDWYSYANDIQESLENKYKHYSYSKIKAIQAALYHGIKRDKRLKQLIN